MSVVSASHARWEQSPARQLAYRTWAADPSLPTAEVARQLEQVHGLKVAVRTVQDWRQRDTWEKRRALERLADAEVSIPEMITELRVAAPLAVRYQRSVLDGTEKPDALRLRAAEAIIREHHAVLELTRETLLAPIAEPPASLDALTTEELLALAEARPALEE